MKKLTAILLVLVSCVAYAAPSVTMRDAWIRAMPPNAKTSAAYLIIENRGGTDDELLGATVDGVAVVELHEMVHEGHAMAMRPRTGIAVPAGGTVALKPGGLHLMLIDIGRPLVAGESRKGRLRFREGQVFAVEFNVRGL